jgi:hypothetical protein
MYRLRLLGRGSQVLRPGRRGRRGRRPGLHSRPEGAGVGLPAQHRRRALDGGVDRARRRRSDTDRGKRRMRVLQAIVESLALGATHQVHGQLALVGRPESSVDALGHQATRSVVVEAHVGIALMPSVSRP